MITNGCEFCVSCYKCPLNWDCDVALEDQCDYEWCEGDYATLAECMGDDWWKE